MKLIKLMSVLLLIFYVSFACEKPLEVSKIDINIGEVLKHISKIKFISPSIMSGFHHYYYKPVVVEKYDDDIKVIKINDNLWIVTKGNPYSFHTGIVLYMPTFLNKVHILGHKSFFPAAWNKEILINKISQVISKVRSGSFNKIECQKHLSGCSCRIDTTLNSRPVRLAIIYDGDTGKIEAKSIYPVKGLDDINISESIIHKLIKEQLLNKKKSLAPKVTKKQPSCVIL